MFVTFRAILRTIMQAGTCVKHSFLPVAELSNQTPEDEPDFFLPGFLLLGPNSITLIC